MAESERDVELAIAQEAPPPARGFRPPATFLVWALTAVNVVVWLAMELAGGSTSGRVLVVFGAKVNALIAQGEYWRLLTPVFLHIGLIHLVFNTFALLSFGRLAEGIYGHARFLAIYLVSGITGAALSYFLTRGVSAGASGAIFGLAGALAIFFAANRDAPPVARGGGLAGILGLLGVNLFFGVVVPGIDNWGHLGGLIGGAALAAWLTPRVRPLAAPEGVPPGWRLEPSSPLGWLVVPLMLGILAVALVVIPGRG